MNEAGSQRELKRTRPWGWIAGALALLIVTWFTGPDWLNWIAVGLVVVLLIDPGPRRHRVPVSLEPGEPTPVLIEKTGPEYIDSIRAVRTHTGMEFSQAKELVSNLPATVTASNPAAAASLVEALTKGGATARVTAE